MAAMLPLVVVMAYTVPYFIVFKHDSWDYYGERTVRRTLPSSAVVEFYKPLANLEARARQAQVPLCIPSDYAPGAASFDEIIDP